MLECYANVNAWIKLLQTVTTNASVKHLFAWIAIHVFSKDLVTDSSASRDLVTIFASPCSPSCMCTENVAVKDDFFCDQSEFVAAAIQRDPLMLSSMSPSLLKHLFAIVNVDKVMACIPAIEIDDAKNDVLCRIFGALDEFLCGAQRITYAEAQDVFATIQRICGHADTPACVFYSALRVASNKALVQLIRPLHIASALREFTSAPLSLEESVSGPGPGFTTRSSPDAEAEAGTKKQRNA